MKCKFPDKSERYEQEDCVLESYEIEPEAASFDEGQMCG
jgi:hypothetical protein